RHPVGTPADGAIGLQSSVPLVRGTFARRPGVGPDRVHEEPRPAAERRGIRQVHDQAFEPSAGQTASDMACFGFIGSSRMKILPPRPVSVPPTDVASPPPRRVVTVSNSVFFSGEMRIAGKMRRYHSELMTALKSAACLTARSPE